MFSLLAFMARMKNNNTAVLEISYFMHNVHHTRINHFEIPLFTDMFGSENYF